MAEVKDKIVTVESLSALHDYDKATYMSMVDPTGSGTMAFNGIINANSIRIGSGIELIPTENSLEIIFLSEEINDMENTEEENVENENTESQEE